MPIACIRNATYIIIRIYSASVLCFWQPCKDRFKIVNRSPLVWGKGQIPSEYQIENCEAIFRFSQNN